MTTPSTTSADPTVWQVQRIHVGADELGTAAPWIPHLLEIECPYYSLRPGTNGPDFIEFKGHENEILYSLPAYGIREITRKGANVVEIKDSPAVRP